ncbi:hypothetical protein TNCV_4409741, partial [Trichonephila clavipes]
MGVNPIFQVTIGFMVLPAGQDKCLTHRLTLNVLRSTSCGMTGARGHGAIVYCLNSGSGVSRR